MDERQKMHRFYSTRWAVLAGVAVMFGWWAYEYYGRGNFRGDFVIILTTMAVIKLAGMLYYRFTD